MRRNFPEKLSIQEALRALNQKSTKKIREAVEPTLKIPSPYNKYFEVIDPNEIEFEDGMFQIGEVVGGATILAYLTAKDEYLDRFDSDAFLIDDPACPVVEVVHDRCYPIDVEELFEEAFRALNKKPQSKIVESVDSDLTNIIETQDAEAATDWILKNTACADPRDIIIEMCEDYGCRSQIYDILALDKYFRVAVPKLTKWWSIWDEDGAFGAAWNMLLIDSDRNIYGACAETQGGPFIYGLEFIPLAELSGYLTKHPVTGNYTPADISDTVVGPGGYNKALVKKICDECEAILPDLDDEDYM